MNKSKPKISIIFPCYNGERFLFENIESIENLHNLNEIELVIVDNNSTDSSIEIIKSFNNIDINLLEQDQNLGFANACNIGVNHASGEFIFITNQDVVFPKDFFMILMNLYRKLRENNELIICPGIVFNKQKINYLGAKIHFLGFSYTPEMYQIIPKKKITFRTQKISGCSMFLKREMFFELNGFDPLFFMYHEDTDFSLKAIRKNIPNYTTNETLLLHKKDHFELNDFTYYYIERNRYICLIKNIKNLKSLLPYILITEVMLLAQAFLQKKLRTRIKIYKFLIQNRKKLKNIRLMDLNNIYPKLRINQLSRNLDPIILGSSPKNNSFLTYILKILNKII